MTLTLRRLKNRLCWVDLIWFNSIEPLHYTSQAGQLRRRTGNLLQPGGFIITGLQLFIQSLGLSQNHRRYNLIDMMFRFTTTMFLLPKPIPKRGQLGSIGTSRFSGTPCTSWRSSRSFRSCFWDMVENLRCFWTNFAVMSSCCQVFL